MKKIILIISFISLLMLAPNMAYGGNTTTLRCDQKDELFEALDKKAVELNLKYIESKTAIEKIVVQSQLVGIMAQKKMAQENYDKACAKKNPDIRSF